MQWARPRLKEKESILHVQDAVFVKMRAYMKDHKFCINIPLTKRPGEILQEST